MLFDIVLLSVCAEAEGMVSPKVDIIHGYANGQCNRKVSSD